MVYPKPFKTFLFRAVPVLEDFERNRIEYNFYFRWYVKASRWFWRSFIEPTLDIDERWLCKLLVHLELNQKQSITTLKENLL